MYCLVVCEIFFLNWKAALVCIICYNNFYYIMVLFKQFYWLSCCHLTFVKFDIVWLKLVLIHFHFPLHYVWRHNEVINFILTWFHFHFILISWNVIFIWETGYWTRAIKRFALFDLLKSLYSDTKILSKYIPSLQKRL